jgi:GABA(A) receptor-associated protein
MEENLRSLGSSIIYNVKQSTNIKKNSGFKVKHSFKKRIDESSRILSKYPDRVPVICEKGIGSDLPDIDRKKYLCPNDISIANFMYIIRKRIKLSPDKSIFLFCGNDATALLPTAYLMSQAYSEHKSEDGFLYITYNAESTFG